MIVNLALFETAAITGFNHIMKDVSLFVEELFTGFFDTLLLSPELVVLHLRVNGLRCSMKSPSGLPCTASKARSCSTTTSHSIEPPR